MKHRSLIAIAAVGTLIFAACGDDDDDAADTVAEATAAGADADVTTAEAPVAPGAETTEAVGVVGAETTEAGVAGADTTEAAAGVATTEAGAAAVTTDAGTAAVETSGPADLAADTTAAGTAAVETSGPADLAADTTAAGTAAETTAAGTAAETTAAGTAAVDTSGPAVQAVESTAVETSAVETSAVETSAVETSAAVEAVESTEPAVETSAVETSAVETTAVETTAVETTAVETTAAETTAVETSAVETTAAVEAVETSAVETSAVETSAVETSAVETSAVETSAVETSAVETTAAAVESSAPTSAPTESSAPTETSAPEGSVPVAEVVGTGPECATLPNFGEGAFSELADQPAGTAISNTQETSTLQQLLGDTELLETLDGEGPFTVFAPRNRAFVDLGEQLSLLAADPDALAATLSYHVVEGEALTSEDLAAEGSAVTLQGEEITVEVEADVVTFNDGQATAVCGDIPIGNGTLFILDAALVPEEVATAITVPATTEAATETSAPADGATGSTEPTASSAPGDSTGTSEAGGAPSGIVFPVTPGPDWPESLTFTLTPSSEAGGLIATAEPLAEMLSERLGVPVEALVPTDYAGVIVALQSGQAHVAGGLGPVQMVQAEDEAGADLILQSERFGSFEYVTQWFTNDPATYCEDEPVADEDGMLFCNGVLDATSAADGPIGEDHLADVAGKTVAFVDQGSASGYLVPALQLLNQGVDPVEDITSQFAGTHDATVQAVYDGDADVGVSFNDARTGLVEQFPDVGEQVVVFAWSFPIPNDGFAVAGDLPDDLKEAITAAFLDIAEDPEGAELLADPDLYEIDGLQPVDSADFDIIRELRTELADLLE